MKRILKHEASLLDYEGVQGRDKTGCGLQPGLGSDLPGESVVLASWVAGSPRSLPGMVSGASACWGLEKVYTR